MTKFSLLAVFTLVLSTAYSQDIKDVRNYSLLGKNKEAKEAVDKYLAIPKNAQKAEGWFYKGSIYNQLSKDTTKSLKEMAELKTDAFEALKKYRELDPKAELLTGQNNSNLYDLYVGFYSDLGVKSYLNKDVATAHEHFKKGLEIHDYIYANNLAGSNGYKFSALDTTLSLYTAITAAEAKKPDDAMLYYKRLADANVADSQFIDSYQFLADYYKTRKDNAAFADIIAKGRKNYPGNNEYWTAMEIEQATEGVGKPEIFAKYDELAVKNPTNYTLPYNHAVEMYRYIYADSMKDVDMDQYKAKLPEVLKKAIGIKSTLEANFLMANFLYNNSIDLSEEARKIRSVKPDDVKNKKALEAQSTAQMNQAIPYAEAVDNLFQQVQKPKGSEKINHKQAFVILKNIYEVKKDAAKVAMYDKKIKELE